MFARGTRDVTMIARSFVLTALCFACAAGDAGSPSSKQIGIGAAIIVVGLFMLWGGATRSEFALYRCLAARPAVCFGEERKHKAMTAFGLLLIVFGSVNASGLLPETGSGGH